jgi:hypothetical protein
MDWQQPLALGIVAATAATLLWRQLRPRRNTFEKAFPCGCAGTGARPTTGLKVQGRRGERARVTLVEACGRKSGQ